MLISLLYNYREVVLAQATCTHYASATATSNTTCSATTPCRISNWLNSVAKAGLTLCLKDGTYTMGNSNPGGSDSTIVNFPSGLSGSPGAPITIRAENDGGADINGEGNYQPIWMKGNNYITLEGFDAHDSCCHIISTDSPYATNLIIRRVVGWNAGLPLGGQRAIFETNFVTDILFEDLGSFGQSGSHYMTFGGFPNRKGILRRIWGMYEGSVHENAPDEVVHAGYFSTQVTVENAIATWLPGVMGGEPGNALMILGITGRENKYLGSIGYYTGNAPPDYGLLQWYSNQYGQAPFSGLVQDVVMYMVGSNSVYPFGWLDYDANGAPCGTTAMPTCYFRNNTSIRGDTNSFFDTPNDTTSWVRQNNLLDMTSVSALNAAGGNIWNGTSTQGARVCYRYDNGVLTKTALWPWPMDARIRRALGRSGRSQAQIDTIFGGANANWPAGTPSVTAKMEQLFGTIPPECRTVPVVVGRQLSLALAFNEGRGSTAFDRSGQNNNGTFGTGVTWSNP